MLRPLPMCCHRSLRSSFHCPSNRFCCVAVRWVCSWCFETTAPSAGIRRPFTIWRWPCRCCPTCSLWPAMYPKTLRGLSKWESHLGCSFGRCSMRSAVPSIQWTNMKAQVDKLLSARSKLYRAQYDVHRAVNVFSDEITNLDKRTIINNLTPWLWHARNAKGCMPHPSLCCTPVTRSSS
jgi:hypothetical protein